MSAEGNQFKAELLKRLDTLDQAKTFLEKCKSASFKVESVEIKPAKKTPSSPFSE